MDAIENGTLDCLGTKLAYYRRSGPGQALLLIHGISDDGATWKAFLPSLDPAWDVVMVDLRGHGRSADPDSGWTLRVMADETAALIRGLGLPSPFVAGCSLGGAVALVLAVYHPELPAAVFLEDPVPIWHAPSSADGDFGAGLEWWLSSVKRKTQAELESEARGNSLWDESEHSAWIESKQRMSFKAIRLARAPDLIPPSFRADAKALSCPLFLVSAEVARGALCRDADIAGLESLVPALESLRLSEAGHNVRRESPAAYRAAFLDFFSRVEAASR
jgi:N-formylmaleamate deformylase